MIGNGWLRRKVRAFYANDRDRTRIEGKVVAYSGGPMVLIEAEDGTRDWWGVELIEVLEEAPPRVSVVTEGGVEVGSVPTT